MECQRSEAERQTDSLPPDPRILFNGSNSGRLKRIGEGVTLIFYGAVLLPAGGEGRVKGLRTMLLMSLPYGIGLIVFPHEESCDPLSGESLQCLLEELGETAVRAGTQE